MRKEELTRPNSLSALRKRQQQEEEERRRDQEYKARLEEIYLSRQAQAAEPEIEEAILDDDERRWHQDRQDRHDFHCRLLAEMERHNHALEQILARLAERV